MKTEEVYNKGFTDALARVSRDLKARMSHEDYTHCETCEETLYHIEAILTPTPQRAIRQNDMTTSEAQNITGKHYPAFKKWMKGKTVGIYPDGTTNYYPWDVQKFMRQFEER